MADEDLDAFTARIRAHRRKKTLAKLVGVGIGLFGIVPAIGLGVVFGFGDDFSGRVFWITWAAMCLVGGLVWQRLEPKEHVDEIE